MEPSAPCPFFGSMSHWGPGSRSARVYKGPPGKRVQGHGSMPDVPAPVHESRNLTSPRHRLAQSLERAKTKFHLELVTTEDERVQAQERLSTAALGPLELKHHPRVLEPVPADV